MDLGFLAATKLQPIVSQLGREVSRILITLGIFPSRKGHGMLREAILCDMIRFHSGGRNANLYRMVAERQGCTPQSCESCIRGALKSAHRCGHLLRLNALLGTAIIDKNYAPPNLEFISLVAQYCYYRFVETE